jgi:hypothetical protein
MRPNNDNTGNRNPNTLTAAGAPGSATSTIGGVGGRGAIEFWPALTEPVNTLFRHTIWVQDEEDDEPSRFLIAGTRIRRYNYLEESSSGTWDDSWDTFPPESVKSGTRPDFLPDFLPTVAFGYDSCSLADFDVNEIKRNALHWCDLKAPILAETNFASRMISDAGALSTAADILIALGQIEAAIAATNSVGFVHMSPSLAPQMAFSQCMIRDPGELTWKTPMGNILIFGGGYSSVLDDASTGASTIIATSQPYGWRNRTTLLTTVYQEQNQFIAVAECSMCIGYEDLVGSAVVEAL